MWIHVLKSIKLVQLWQLHVSIKSLVFLISKNQHDIWLWNQYFKIFMYLIFIYLTICAIIQWSLITLMKLIYIYIKKTCISEWYMYNAQRNWDLDTLCLQMQIFFFILKHIQLHVYIYMQLNYMYWYLLFSNGCCLKVYSFLLEHYKYM